MADAYLKGIQVLLAPLHCTLPLLSQVPTDRFDSSKLTVHLPSPFKSLKSYLMFWVVVSFFSTKQKLQRLNSFVKGVRKMTRFPVSLQLFWPLILSHLTELVFHWVLLFIVDSAQLFRLLCIYSCKWLCSHTPSYNRQALSAHSAIRIRSVIWMLAYERRKHSCVSGMDKVNESVNLILLKQYVWQLFLDVSWLSIFVKQ